jgi:ribosomal subunit interface protein
MKKDIQTVGFDANDALLEMVDSYLDKLENHNGLTITGADVYLKSVNEKPNSKVCEIKLYLNGPDVYAETKAEGMQDALHASYQKVKTQLDKRHSQTKDTYHKQGV